MSESPIIVVTNRNLQPNESDPLERFGPRCNEKSPSELRLALAQYHEEENWSVDILEDSVEVDGQKMPASEHAFRQLQKRMREHNRNCLFFVHGFNNDFRDAIKTARDLQRTYDVEVILFTWPANGRDVGGVIGGAASYRSDKKEANLSVHALDRVFEKLHGYLRKYDKEACDMCMSVMFHSMGNYLFKGLFRSSVYMGETALFDNVILAQADVNNRAHEDWVDRISFRNRLYITINEKDYALRLSRIKFGEAQQARLGHYTINLNSRTARYIDFTGAKGVKKSHSPFDSATAERNGLVFETFRRMIHGERAEENLTYNIHTRAYEVRN